MLICFGGKHHAIPYSLPHRRVDRWHSPHNKLFSGKETLKSQKGGLCKQSRDFGDIVNMAFFTSAVDTLKVLVIAIGAGLGVWGVINLLEGYGNDNPGANAQVW